MIDNITKSLGHNVVIRVGNRQWRVPRFYIAVCGLRASELPFMGFPEVEASDEFTRPRKEFFTSLEDSEYTERLG